MTIEQRIAQAEAQCEGAFKQIDDVALANTARVLDAFHKHEVGTRHFAATTGYGYGDIGRDTLEAIYADLFGTQTALVRPQIASGTHALALCLFGLLLPGDELLSVTGTPYDTLEGIIGIHQPTPGSLAEMGVTYRQVELNTEGKLDMPAIWAALRPDTRVVAVQRSRGYSSRRSLSPEEIAPLSAMLHKEYPNVCLLVDNCYGEFVQVDEPSHFGADVCVGSLIKNPGGGLAPTGGYIVGRRDLVERISYRLTAPGVGAEIGSYAAGYQSFYQGLFMAPHTVGQALRTATLAAAVFSQLRIPTTPGVEEPRTDIIQALQLGTPERVVAFCQGIQAASPIDSMAVPEPWDMPGYQEQVIMAAGTFVSGASIELSADAPMREPYTVYLQGGLSYEHGKLALMRTLQHMENRGCLAPQ